MPDKGYRASSQKLFHPERLFFSVIRPEASRTSKHTPAIGRVTNENRVRRLAGEGMERERATNAPNKASKEGNAASPRKQTRLVWATMSRGRKNCERHTAYRNGCANTEIVPCDARAISVPTPTPEIEVNMSKRKDYNRYLQSDHWADLRRRKFSESGRNCKNCGSVKVPHVHHINYRHLIDCTLDDLLVLCKICHDDLHCGAQIQKIDLAGVELQMIRAIIFSFRLTDEYRKRQERLERRRLGIKLVQPAKNAEGKKHGKIFRKCLRRCRLEKYSVASIQNFIAEAQKIVEERNLRNSVLRSNYS
jgi:hypothetical protein